MTEKVNATKSLVAPNFIVLGAQRCGTTWMQRCVIEHPEIYVPAWRTGSIYLGEADMAGHTDESLIGVFNATLLTRKEVPEDIVGLASNVKLVAVVRNPVDRAYSWYHLRMRQGDGIYARQPTFEQALSLDPDLVSNGIYTPHLNNYRELVGKENMLIGVFDDLKTNPLQFITEVLRFVGATDTENPPEHWAESVNYSAVVKNRRLHMFARRAKSRTKRLLGARNQWLVDRLEQSRLVVAFKQANENEVDRLDEAVRYRLFDEFADDIASLETLLDRDLSAWHPH